MLAKITVADYMTKRVVTLKEDTDVVEAIQMMLDHKITCAPVVDNHGNLVGMFSERDSMKVVLETAYNQSMVGKIGEFMSRDIMHVDANSSILDLAEKFESSNVRSFPVFEDSELVGVVSRTDVLKALTAKKKK